MPKRILLVSAKWPFKSNSNDGGDSTLRELIEALGKDNILDLLCFRNDITGQEKIPYVNRLYVYAENFASFENYSFRDGKKFLCRLDQSVKAAKVINDFEYRYDLVVIQHVMFVLGLCNNSNLLKKVVLFPMFLGKSYVLSGERVPIEYIEKEKEIIPNIGKIVCPSNMEKKMLVDYYSVNVTKIYVIPRPVTFNYMKKIPPKNKNVNVIYIAAIRLQKNHWDAIKLVELLLKQEIDVKLTCVGAIQDNKAYKEYMKYILKNGLESHIIFVGNKSKKELIAIMKKNDINISVSNWETFGRGIYEGMAAGLPTIVLDRIECIKDNEFCGEMPLIVDNIQQMAYEILKLINEPDYFLKENIKGKIIVNKLNSSGIYNQLAALCKGE